MKVLNQNVGLSARTIGQNVKLPGLRFQPLFNPALTVQKNSRVQQNLKQFDPIEPGKIRAEGAATLRRSVDKINVQLAATSSQLTGVRFQVHEESGRSFAVVTDQRTGRQINKIPSDATLTLAARLKDVSGILVNTKG